MKHFFALLISILFLQSCTRAPQTKEEYLEEYSQFIEQIGEESEGFDTDDWKEQDETYELYSNEYYDKFSDELSYGEQFQVKGYGIAYHTMKQKEGWEAVGDFIESIGTKGGEALERFFEDAGDETEEIGDALNRIGDIVEDKFEDIAEDMEDELKDSEDVLERFAKKAEDAMEDFVENIEEDIEELEKKLDN